MKDGDYVWADRLKEQLFTSSPAEKAIPSLAVSTVIAQLITVVCDMADTFFVCQLGDTNQIAAATLAIPPIYFSYGIANIFKIGGLKFDFLLPWYR